MPQFYTGDIGIDLSGTTAAMTFGSHGFSTVSSRRSDCGRIEHLHSLQPLEDKGFFFVVMGRATHHAYECFAPIHDYRLTDVRFDSGFPDSASDPTPVITASRASESPIVDEFTYLRTQAVKEFGDERAKQKLDVMQSMALRISAQANIKLIAAGFLHEPDLIEFILVNEAGTRRLTLDAALDREEVWAHMVTSENDVTENLLPESPVQEIARWLKQ